MVSRQVGVSPPDAHLDCSPPSLPLLRRVIKRSILVMLFFFFFLLSVFVRAVPSPYTSRCFGLGGAPLAAESAPCLSDVCLLVASLSKEGRCRSSTAPLLLQRWRAGKIVDRVNGVLLQCRRKQANLRGGRKKFTSRPFANYSL